MQHRGWRSQLLLDAFLRLIETCYDPMAARGRMIIPIVNNPSYPSILSSFMNQRFSRAGQNIKIYWEFVRPVDSPRFIRCYHTSTFSSTSKVLWQHDSSRFFDHSITMFSFSFATLVLISSRYFTIGLADHHLGCQFDGLKYGTCYDYFTLSVSVYISHFHFAPVVIPFSSLS
jgi:hypothetical protein